MDSMRFNTVLGSPMTGIAGSSIKEGIVDMRTLKAHIDTLFRKGSKPAVSSQYRINKSWHCGYHSRISIY